MDKTILTDAEVEAIKNVFAHFKDKPVDEGHIQKDVVAFEAILRRTRCVGCSRKGTLQHYKMSGREYLKCGHCGFESE